MTVDWFDLGQRLRAAHTGQVVARLAGAPIVAAAHPVAVRITGVGVGCTVQAAAGGRGPVSASGADALRMLGDLGVRISAPSPATLVIDSSTTLVQLLALARAFSTPGGQQDDVAAHIAWWCDRADFPGGRAVADLPTACRARWATGTLPAAENNAATWRAWLNISDDYAAGLIYLHARVSEGHPLAWLSDLAEDSIYSWQAAQSQYSDGLDWRRPDSTARAATGLRARCDAADLYAAALLSDPLHRLRGVHTGHVTTGLLVPSASTAGRQLRHQCVLCDRPDTRLRPGTDVIGWAGRPEQSGAPRFRATVAASAITASQLSLALTGVSGNVPAAHLPVTLIPAPPNVRQQIRGRSNYRSLYAARRSWLTAGRTPTLTRREVPLAVLVAAATDD